MSVILLINFWLILLLTFAKVRQDWREAFIFASLSWGTAVVACTEMLSLGNYLTFTLLLLFWLGITALSLIYFIRLRKAPYPPVSFGKIPLLSTIGVIFVISITGMIAISAPPNTWDSMTYHMPRVMHWIQNQSVEHYPSHISRQLYLPPFAEFVIMHLQILSGGDRLANLVQWFSLIGSIVAVSLITRQIGGNVHSQAISSLFVATIPMGILQSTSTQNDFVVSFLIACFVYTGLRLIDQLSYMNSIAAGMALGLATLTKGTAYIYAVAFVIYFAINSLRRHKFKILPHMVVICFLFCSINVCHFVRNYTYFGNPLSTANAKYTNEAMSLGLITSNILRNVSLNLITPSSSINSQIEQIVRGIHGKLGISADDPRISWRNLNYGLSSDMLSENTAGNALHILLVAVAFPFAILLRKSNRKIAIYGVLVVATYVLFCYLLKWQPWSTRLQLPFFVLASPLMIIVEAIRKENLLGLQSLLFIMALPWLFLNSSRPFLGEKSVFIVDRWQQYFIGNPGLKTQFEAVAEKLGSGQCNSVGLLLGNDTWEYPLWVATANKRAIIKHVEVSNKSGVIYQDERSICLAVDLRTGKLEHRLIK